MLAWADANSNLRLALRSPREPIRSRADRRARAWPDRIERSRPAPPAPVPAIGSAAPIAVAAARRSARRARAHQSRRTDRRRPSRRSSVPNSQGTNARASDLGLHRLQGRRRHDDALPRAGARHAREASVALVDADLTGSRSVAVLFEAVRSLDAERDATSPILACAPTASRSSNLPTATTPRSRSTSERREASSAICGGFDADHRRRAAALSRPRRGPSSSRATPLLHRLGADAAWRRRRAVDARRSQALRRAGHPHRPDHKRAQANLRSCSAREIERALESKVVAEIPLSTSRNYAKSDRRARNATSRRFPSASRCRTFSRRPAAVGHGRSLRRRRTGARTTMRPPPDDPKRDAFKQEVHAALVRQLDLVTASHAHGDAAKLAELRSKVESIAASARRAEQISRIGRGARRRCAERSSTRRSAWARWKIFMRDPDVTEIMVNGPDMIYVERHGKIERTTQALQPTIGSCA